MFEDFTYITDENFLSNHWLEEKVPCRLCKAQGKVLTDRNRLINCPVCHGKKMIERRRENATYN